MKKVIMILVVVCYLIPCCHGEDMPVIEWSERTTHDSQLDQLFDNEMENDEQDNSSVLLDETRSLMQGDKGSRVLKLQEQLVKLGYISGGAYGNYGPRTEEAVKKAQEAFGMEITGIADQEFLDRL